MEDAAALESHREDNSPPLARREVDGSGVGLADQEVGGLEGDAAEVRVVGTALVPHPSEMPKLPEGDEPGPVVEPVNALQSSVKAAQQVKESAKRRLRMAWSMGASPDLRWRKFDCR